MQTLYAFASCPLIVSSFSKSTLCVGNVPIVVECGTCAQLICCGVRLQIGGCTLHSWAGIGLGEELKQGLADKARNSKKTCARWRKTDVLLIDEVSMVDADIFDKVSPL